MILTILLTFWITCGIIYISKELARPFNACRSDLIILEFIFSPYFITSDIIQYWKECKDIRLKYKK